MSWAYLLKLAERELQVGIRTAEGSCPVLPLTGWVTRAGAPSSLRLLSHLRHMGLVSLIPQCPGQPPISTQGHVLGRDQRELGGQRDGHRLHLFHKKSGERKGRAGDQ